MQISAEVGYSTVICWGDCLAARTIERALDGERGSPRRLSNGWIDAGELQLKAARGEGLR